MRKLSPARVRTFRRKVYRHFEAHGREFSWRKTRDPYHVLVSEVMLQQTQTARVEEKFREFIARFPDFASLARAPLGDVLRAWQGMGYNRRALYLHQAAREVTERRGGRLPSAVEALETLPGIGPATARSIAVYAFNRPEVFIETNIRTVFIHEFFRGKEQVSDADIRPLVERTIDARNPWKWYNALMDYGVMLKEKHGNLSRRSLHYAKQSPFMSSDRRIRGALLRCLAAEKALTVPALLRRCPFPADRLRKCLTALCTDGLVTEKNGRYSLP